MINGYLVFCKVVYDYYVRKEGIDGGPKFTTTIVTTIIIWFNLVSLSNILTLYIYTHYKINYMYGVLLMVLIGFFNYFLFINREELYVDIEIENKHKRISLLMICFTIIFAVITGYLHRVRNI